MNGKNRCVLAPSRQDKTSMDKFRYVLFHCYTVRTTETGCDREWNRSETGRSGRRSIKSRGSRSRVSVEPTMSLCDCRPETEDQVFLPPLFLPSISCRVSNCMTQIPSQFGTNLKWSTLCVPFSELERLRGKEGDISCHLTKVNLSTNHSMRYVSDPTSQTVSLTSVVTTVTTRRQ